MTGPRAHYPGDGCPSTPPSTSGRALEQWEAAHRPPPLLPSRGHAQVRRDKRRGGFQVTGRSPDGRRHRVFFEHESAARRWADRIKSGEPGPEGDYLPRVEDFAP